MITREEALKSEPLVTPNGYYNKVYRKSEYTAIINLIFDQQDQLDQRIKSLEAQISNAEQLTCEECANNSYLDCPCFDYSNGRDPIIQYCSEYKPKDTQ